VDGEAVGKTIHELWAPELAVPLLAAFQTRRFTCIGPRAVERFGYPAVEWLAPGSEAPLGSHRSSTSGGRCSKMSRLTAKRVAKYIM
jgi:hypothetical protein